MKRIFQYAIIALLMSTAYLSGQAQQQQLQLKLGYNINTPAGSFKNFIGKTSFRGLNGEISYSINDQVNVGLGASFSDFYQKYPRQVYDTKDGNISAVVTNSIQTMPVLAKAGYSFLKGTVKPYVGIGAGLNLISYNQYLGEFPDGKALIKPAFSADAGVNIPVGKLKSSGFNLGANFNYLPFNYTGLKNLNNWGVHAGVFFPLGK